MGLAMLIATDPKPFDLRATLIRWNRTKIYTGAAITLSSISRENLYQINIGGKCLLPGRIGRQHKKMKITWNVDAFNGFW